MPVVVLTWPGIHINHNPYCLGLVCITTTPTTVYLLDPVYTLSHLTSLVSVVGT